MRRLLSLVLSLTIALSPAGPALGRCDEYLTQLTMDFRGKPITVFAPSDTRSLDPVRAFGPTPQVFLGITPGGHWYFLVGGVEITGATPPIPIFKVSGGFHDGVLIHFPDIPPEEIAAWLKDMQRRWVIRGWALSCIQAATGALRSGFGIRIKRSLPGPNIFTAGNFRNLLENGFVDRDGKPVRTVVYAVTRRTPDLKAIYGHLIAQDKIFALIAAVGGLSIGSILTTTVTEWLRHSKAKRPSETLPTSEPPPPAR